VAITGWQAVAFTDSMSIYRQDARDRNSRGESTGLRLVASGVACKKHDTDNYDAATPVGQIKRNNIDTSDKVECALTVDLRAEDTVYITTSDGRTDYFKIAGATKGRTILGYQKGYITIEPIAPTIISGAWVS
jgi:hypothetical protein